jgi:hypothetical protein
MLSKNIFNVISFFFISFTLQANVIILNGLTHIHNGEKGTLIQGEIILQNMNKTNSERITVYLKDILQSCNGKTEYLEMGSHPRSLSSWVSFNTSEKVLSPNEKFIITYTINIPSDIKLDNDIDYGSFWSAIMIEVAKPINEDSQYGVQINSKIRYGIQIITNVGEKLDAPLEFQDITIAKENPTTYAMDIILKNNGLFMVQPTLILELFDSNGNSVKKAEALFKKVYPNGCKDFKITFSDVPSGDYEAVLVADYGGEIFGINVSVNIADK